MDLLQLQLELAVKGKFDIARRIVDQLEKERPECHRCAYNRGWFHLNHCEFKKGFECLERGRLIGVHGNPFLQTGRPIWKDEPYFIWALPGNKSPWYDSVTLYRQKEYGKWGSVFNEVRNDLVRKIA